MAGVPGARGEEAVPSWAEVRGSSHSAFESTFSMRGKIMKGSTCLFLSGSIIGAQITSID